MTDTTVLRLTGMGVPPYSARGLSQSLTPISASQALRRTINGKLVDVSNPLLRKYASVITGNDQQPPALDMVWPGTRLTVDCITELSVEGEFEAPTDGETEHLFGRNHVPGSVRTESGFTFYRPRLIMRVVDFNVDRDEWGAAVGWTLSLEEDETE